ncbi:DNA methyltransferase 1-associated protein-like protein DMAP1 [Calycina marina]|uniref:SWR1-complex protein 4 n=1 Tax=Calycina marina TaxID=1763456 RepID=A0A9P8CIK3_9HELO|nr:DNA methyltransferase 1-associated protein-like protein DMAP1 [Calycina marina]
MTPYDVRDMLDLPGSAGLRPAKKQRVAGTRTNLKGLAREVQSLGGDNSIAIVPEISVFKRRRLTSRKPAARWLFQPFTNSAREDGLKLQHWRKKEDITRAPVAEEDNDKQIESVPLPVEDYTFAKFNVRVRTEEYSNEEYTEHLQDPNWTKEETDYLMKVVKNFDLRWPVIWDRYEFTPKSAYPEDQPVPAVIRSMEDLKARYYKLSAIIMKLRTPPDRMQSAQFDNMEKMKAFDPAQEEKRKQYAEVIFSRTREEAKEEESLLLELKRILARSDKMNEQRTELYSCLEAPPTKVIEGNNIATFSTSAGLQGLLQHIMQTDKSRKRRSILEPGSGISPAIGQHPDLHRRESNIRDSISGPSGNPSHKKAAPHSVTERRLSAEDEALYGVTHPTDRSTSGPIFRREKLAKIITNKSAMQQARILNTLGELNVPRDVIMPTSNVGGAYTILLDGVMKMLDVQKHVEKAEAELKLVQSQKEEVDRRERAAKGIPEPDAEGNNAEPPSAGPETSGAAQSRAGSVQRSVRGESLVPRTASGTHKRSASVMSVGSENGTKRQRK